MRKFLGVGIAVAMLVMLMSAAHATEPAKATTTTAKPAGVTVTGEVKVTKDNGKVTGIDIVHESTTYKVVMNTEAKKLEAYNGKSVSAKGVVAEKDEVKNFTVKSFKVVPPPKPAAAKS